MSQRSGRRRTRLRRPGPQANGAGSDGSTGGSSEASTSSPGDGPTASPDGTPTDGTPTDGTAPRRRRRRRGGRGGRGRSARSGQPARATDPASDSTAHSTPDPASGPAPDRARDTRPGPRGTSTPPATLPATARASSRRGGSAVKAGSADSAGSATPRANGRTNGRAGGQGGARQRWLRRVDEYSAGGLVVDLAADEPCAAIIGRTDRRGRLLWSLPKGHIEAGETAEQAAVREVAEETGINGEILAELGTIDFWFVAEGKRVHKTVRHYLMRATGGELSDADVEVTEVAWVPLAQLRAQLAYPDEQGLVDTADRLLAETA